MARLFCDRKLYIGRAANLGINFLCMDLTTTLCYRGESLHCYKIAKNIVFYYNEVNDFLIRDRQNIYLIKSSRLFLKLSDFYIHFY